VEISEQTPHNSISNYMRGFGGSLTKYYLSKVVQRVIMKPGGNPAQNLTANRYHP